jgi:hypothetical protein
MSDATASVDSPAYAFSAREVSRLAIYRAAVQASFFSDIGPLAAPVDSALADRLTAHRERQAGSW